MTNFTHPLRSVSSPRHEIGVTPFYRRFSVLAADLALDDTFVLAKMPNKAYLPKASFGILPTDMDTNVSPLLGLDVGFGSGAGVISTAIIAASAAAQTGVADFADTAVADIVDVSGLHLILKIQAAAATGAAGTIDFWFTLWANLNRGPYQLKER